MLGVVGRNTHRLIDHGQLPRVLLFGLLDPALDVVHRLQVLLELRPVAGPHARVQAFDLLVHDVEDAPIAPDPGQPRGRVRASTRAEQAFEERPRVVIEGQRRGRRAPGNRVRQCAARAVARPQHRRRLDAELEGAQLRLFAEALRRHLIHRRLGDDVGVGDGFERHARQEGTRRARMVT